MKTKISLMAVAMLFVFSNVSAQVPCFNWGKKLGGTNGNYDQAMGTATDAAGNVYVTGNISYTTMTFGSTILTTNPEDLFLVKYDPAGNVLWAQSAGGGQTDVSNSICTDPSGNIYITGSSTSTSVTFGSITINDVNGIGFYVAKYDASGNALWVRSSGSGTGYNIVADNSGNVFVTGTYSSTMNFGSFSLAPVSGNGDFFLVKYDASGTALWAQGAGGNGNDQGLSVSVDASSNVYVAGLFGSTSITFGSTTLNNADASHTDIFSAKYNSSGSVQWAIGVGGIYDEESPGVTSDPEGNVYFHGAFRSPNIEIGSVTLTNTVDYPHPSTFVSKLDPGGNVLWVNDPIPWSFLQTPDNGSVIGPDGNFYLMVGTPYSRPAIIGNYTIVNWNEISNTLVKYDPAGNIFWAKPMDGREVPQANAIALDNSNNIYVLGNYWAPTIDLDGTTLTGFCCSPDGLDMFLAKCDQQNFSNTTFYVDFDLDGYGTTSKAVFCSSTPLSFYTTDTTDCDDNDPLVHPRVFYVDADNDGFGSTATTTFCQIDPPSGYARNNSDCDDNDASHHVPFVYYVDADNDGYGSTASAVFCSSSPPAGYSVNNADCDDNNASIIPYTYYVDADHDGYGSNLTGYSCSPTPPPGFSTNNLDCNDSYNGAYPGAPELCDGIDNNCNGQIDEACTPAPSLRFKKQYGTENEDAAYAGTRTSDGGYIMVGYTTNADNSLTDVYVVKTNINGDLMWAKNFNEGYTEYRYAIGYGVKQTSDGGYIIGAYEENNFTGKVYLIKIDANGNLQWSKNIGDNDYQGAFSIELTSDGGYIIGGWANGSELFNAGAYLIKTDSLGNIIWTKVYVDAGFQTITSVHQTTDGGYILAGFNYPNTVLLIKTDSNGSILWSEEFGNNGGGGFFNLNSVVETGDGYVVAGYNFVLDNSNQTGYDGLISKTDLDGNLLWSKVFSSAPGLQMILLSISKTSDGGFICAGRGSPTFFDNHHEAVLIKTDADGNLTWAKRYDVPQYIEGYSVVQTPDNGFALFGLSDYGLGSHDALLMKTDSLGNTNCDAVDLSLTVTSVGYTATPWTPATIFDNFGISVDTPTIVTPLGTQFDVQDVVSASSNSPVCTGGTLNLFSSDGVSYSWTGPNSFTSTEQNPVIANVTNDNTGAYYVQVTDSNGCTGYAVTVITITQPTLTFYQDADADGYGNPDVSVMACEAPSGYVTDNTDCNDNDAAIHSPVQYYVDADHDGFGSTATAMICASSPPVGYSTDNTDCNDNDASVHSPVQYYVDADHDGFGSTATAMVCASTPPSGYSTDNTDCNDNNAAIHPEGAEVCGNGIDDNCNGQIDEGCCSISVSAGIDETLYFGYAPDQCVSKTVVITNGTPPYSYNWMLDRALLSNVITPSGDETMTGANSQTVTVCLLDTAQLCVTVTDAHGCSASDCATIFAEDVRCFAGNNQKVTMCWNHNTICVSSNAVNAHLAQGATLGACSSSRLDTGAEGSDFTVYPNPSNGMFELEMSNGKYSNVKVYDLLGNVIYSSETPAAKAQINLSQITNGVYFITVTDENNNSVTKKIVKM